MPVRHSMAVHTFPHSSANTMCILFDECISAKCCGIHKFFAFVYVWFAKYNKREQIMEGFVGIIHSSRKMS